MLEVIKTVAESVALGTALVIASLDFSGASASLGFSGASASLGFPSAHAQTINVIRPGGAMPSVVYPSGAGRGEAIAQRQRDGHFYFDADIGGAKIHTVFDTGASDVVLRAEDAEKIGMDVDRLRFDRVSSTANGRAAYAAVVIPSMTVGGITRRNVTAAVGKPGALGVTLLGQSFSSRLSSFKQDGDTLTLLGE
jgi:aspartyl protease family protein